MNDFSINARIYYENTDAGGVVFYGEYLRFFERARTEYLRSKGHNIADMMKQDNPVLFVVKKVTIDYLKPLFLDNMIDITANIIKQTKTSYHFEQNIYHNQILMTKAQIICVCVNKQGRPQRTDLKPA